MKPRKVHLSIDVMTDAPLKDLRGASVMYLMPYHECVDGCLSIDQIQANVIRPAKAKKGGA